MPRFFEKQDQVEGEVRAGTEKRKGQKRGATKRGEIPDPGPLPVDHKKYQNLLRSQYALNPKLATNIPIQRKRLAHVKERTKSAIVRQVRSDALLTEESGFIEAEDNEETYQITQKEIQENVDITAASKHFDLELAHGPYTLDFFRNGRQLVIGGRKGHVACFDWLTKQLKCEFNVQESVHDVQFLHLPAMFAVAQKDWVYMYDDNGTELHCIRKMFRVQHLDFLPYHFLLVSASENGFLSWLDVSTGEIVSQFPMNHASNKLTCMTQNRTNAIIHTGHPNGTVALWSPNMKQPVVKMLANASTVRGIAVNSTGRYMATSGVDRTLKIYDLRNYKCVHNYKLRTVPSSLSFSQKDMLSVGLGDVVEVYQGVCGKKISAPYLRHRLSGGRKVTDCSFVNYEDVLGVAHEGGYTSLLVPGSGEANFDAYESNPFMTRSQKREMEVKALLEKVSPDLISVDARTLSKVDVDALERDREAARQKLHVKLHKVDLTRVKTKNRKGEKVAKTKERLLEIRNRERIQKLAHLSAPVTAPNNQSTSRHPHLSPSSSNDLLSMAATRTGSDSTTGPKDIYSRFKSRA